MSLRAFALFLLMVSSAAPADEAALRARDGWIRAAPPVAQVRAGYLVIENVGDTEVVLTSVESADFGAIEIHTMFDDAGTMRMRRVPELRVPAHGKVELKPGGLHLMMFRPQRALSAGDEVMITISGAGAAVTTKLVVRSE
ncbi:MAG: copper chaperone PCu(A)C [Rhodanobacteraceae bacterium]|nr:copper chaperone PCu(A)C [Rhodanobacteraceae bacterium]MBL0040987.1 copper chaperone PCu(A)C [Xanthomonadales bacterium]